MPSKVVFSKQIFSLLVILLVLVFSVPCFAHDETDSSLDTEVAPTGKLNVRGAKTSTIKVVVKYPTTLANKKAIIEIILNDLATNEPVTGANITAIFNYFPLIEKSDLPIKPLFSNALPTEAKGNYLAEVTFHQTGRYKLTLIMSKPGVNAQVIIPNIIIPDKIPEPKEDKILVETNSKYFITLGVILFLGISSLIVLILNKRRAAI